MATLRSGHLKNNILPQFGEGPLSDINSVEIENWIMGVNRTNVTKNAILHTFGIVMREAKREKLIAVSQIDDVEALAIHYRARDVFRLAELKKLFLKNREKLLEIWTHLKYASCFHTMATTGIRSGEPRALQWQDVSWDLKGLLILRAVKADGSIRQQKAKEIPPVYLSEQGF